MSSPDSVPVDIRRADFLRGVVSVAVTAGLAVTSTPAGAQDARASPAGTQAKPATEGGVWIEVAAVPDLNAPAVHQWNYDQTSNNPFPGPAPTAPAGMAAAQHIDSSATTDDAGNALTVITAVRSDYNVVSKRRLLGKVRTTSYYIQPITIVFRATLFVQQSLPTSDARRTKILQAFASYNPQKDGDPAAYAASKMGADVKPYMFSVLPSYRLVKNGSLHKDESEYIALEAFYRGSFQGTIDVGHLQEENLEQFMQMKQFKLVPVSTVMIGEAPSPRTDPLRVIPVNDFKNPPSDVFDKVYSADQKNTDCNELKKISHPTMTLLAWPEWKVEWSSKRIDIGCGVFIKIWLPKLLTRTSQLVLYRLVQEPAAFGQLLENQVDDCLVMSIISGAVVGLYTSDFEAALAAFIATFAALIAAYIASDVECIIPDLALIEQSSGWS